MVNMDWFICKSNKKKWLFLILCLGYNYVPLGYTYYTRRNCGPNETLNSQNQCVPLIQIKQPQFYDFSNLFVETYGN